MPLDKVPASNESVLGSWNEKRDFLFSRSASFPHPRKGAVVTLVQKGVDSVAETTGVVAHKKKKKKKNQFSETLRRPVPFPGTLCGADPCARNADPDPNGGFQNNKRGQYRQYRAQIMTKSTNLDHESLTNPRSCPLALQDTGWLILRIGGIDVTEAREYQRSQHARAAPSCM